MLAPAADRGR
jgi:non-homologous end joining protein Ku